MPEENWASHGGVQAVHSDLEFPDKYLTSMCSATYAILGRYELMFFTFDGRIIDRKKGFSMLQAMLPKDSL
jgi:hypothetical protein